MLDLLAGLDQKLIKQVKRQHAKDTVQKGRARAIAIQNKRSARRAKCEQVLSEILPAELDRDTSYHVMSHGDVDALSYLRHVVNAQSLDSVYLSTWCMALPDVQEIQSWLEAGRLGVVNWFVGEIFPNQYCDEYELVSKLVQRHGGRLCVARNHSKVMLEMNAEADYFAVIESSANVNTNPRIEQTAIHRNEDLYWFYRDFFDGLVSIDRQSRIASAIRPDEGRVASSDR